MKTCVALLRGVNVVGKNQLPMKELARLMENLGFHDVRTYIQSGNAVFRCEKNRASKIAVNIKTAIAAKYGFAPHVLVLAPRELEDAMTSNPFMEAEMEPKTLHLFFLDSAPKNPNVKLLESIRTGNERFALKDKVFYLYTPEGFAHSKLAARAEKALGVPATARNWRSVGKIMALAKQVA